LTELKTSLSKLSSISQFDLIKPDKDIADLRRIQDTAKQVGVAL